MQTCGNTSLTCSTSCHSLQWWRTRYLPSMEACRRVSTLSTRCARLTATARCRTKDQCVICYGQTQMTGQAGAFHRGELAILNFHVVVVFSVRRVVICNSGL